jgi:hypothetical protein
VFEKTLTAVGTVRPYAAAVRDRSMTETSGEQRRAMRHPPPPVPSPSGLVGLDDRLRNAPAVARLVPVLPGPPADRVSLLAVRPSGCAGHRRLPSGAALPTRTSVYVAQEPADAQAIAERAAPQLDRRLSLIRPAPRRATAGHRFPRTAVAETKTDPAQHVSNRGHHRTCTGEHGLP